MSERTTGRRSYLDTAAESGVLRRLDGRPYVAGGYVDPASGECQFLVEYCDPAILADPAAIDALVASAARGGAATHMLLRVGPDAVDLAPPWAPYQTYVRYAGPPAAVPERSVIRPAGPEETPLVAAWLADAVTRAATEQDMLTDGFDASASTGDWLAAPDRRSFVYLARGRPVGHVTMLAEAYDDVYDEEFVDLIDILVDPAHDVRAGTRALTAVAVAYAAGLGRPLIGNVIHPARDIDGHADRVLRRLAGAGWTVAYRFLKRPLR